jgi:hypothetical protein
MTPDMNNDPAVLAVLAVLAVAYWLCDTIRRGGRRG